MVFFFVGMSTQSFFNEIFQFSLDEKTSLVTMQLKENDVISESTYYPDQDTITEFLKIYIDHYSGNNLDQTTKEILLEEVAAFTPFMILEQFYYQFKVAEKVSSGLVCEYQSYNDVQGRETSLTPPIEVTCPRESNSSKPYLSFLLLLFVIN